MSDPICPECAQGKHRNCVGEALDDDDRIVACMCPECGPEACTRCFGVGVVDEFINGDRVEDVECALCGGSGVIDRA